MRHTKVPNAWSSDGLFCVAFSGVHILLALLMEDDMRHFQVPSIWSSDGLFGGSVLAYDAQQECLSGFGAMRMDY